MSSEFDISQFLSGNSFNAYEYFGVHKTIVNGTAGYNFKVYAPNAAAVYLMGDFSNWIKFPMERDEHGVYHAFCADAKEWDIYKYVIADKFGNLTEKTDPYGFYCEKSPDTGSIICRPDSFTFDDDEYIKGRNDCYNRPMNIYEIHAGSWRTKVNNTEEGELSELYNFSELTDKLIPYIIENGFTHVEFLPLAEHPFYGSWGYQGSGFFAFSSRYGKPNDLKSFINVCHKNNIGVIMDYVPVHFAADRSFLHLFDGTPLYEYDSNDTMYNSWGSCNFCHSKPVCASFLKSAANFWIENYHADGLRMDAISNMIYWLGDSKRGVNVGAVNFLKTLNDGLHERHNGVLLMAEDSTDFLKVTAPVKYDGLGFDYKWDMGFMNDTLEFFKYTPEERKQKYGKILFSMEYFYNELFLLSFSHDEVVHGKATIIQKMWGDYEVKFPQCRCLFTYFFAHPGKKLNFMGNEIAQFREWDETREMDWDDMKYPLHDSFHRFFRDLSLIYKYTPALYDGEYNPEKFEWLENNAPNEGVFAFKRFSGDSCIIFVMNVSDKKHEDLRIPSGCELSADEIINSDNFIYSGTGIVNERIETEDIPYKGKPYSFKLSLAPFSAAIFRI